ncbi:MAG: transposase family protein [Planctomycetes bacterium]|nr:transposase family protein [Planctomycetota bacterium]
MGVRKVEINLNTVCGGESKVGIRSFGGVFSSRAEMLTSRADILNDKDRALMKMYLRNGLTFRQIAHVSGMNETTVARRIHKLTAKLIDGEYITCLRNRDRFNRIEMTVSRDYFLEGISQKKIAKKRKLTVYSTRKILLKIREVIDACRTRRQKGDMKK